jgi:hypothetical protein
MLVGQSWRAMESGLGGFFLHRLGGRFYWDQNADLGFLTFDDAAEVANVRGLS